MEKVPNISALECLNLILFLQEAEQIRVSPLVKDGRLLEFLYEDARTLHEAFLRGLRLSSENYIFCIASLWL